MSMLVLTLMVHIASCAPRTSLEVLVASVRQTLVFIPV